MSKFKLPRTIQCAKCPWKVGTNPHEIPDGYCVNKHKNLKSTIAKDDSYVLNGTLRIMACHQSKDTKENAEYCVGWVHNQIGIGNNIPLRLKMMNCANISELKVVGEQHQTFEDTLPK